MAKRENIGLSRELRQTENRAEEEAWQTLRLLRKEGWPVRRQHQIGPYIVDFAITKARLVIEVDGGIHREQEVAARDVEREGVLRADGWNVLRVSAQFARHGDHLIEMVRAEIKRCCPLTLHPSPQGERGT
ncbi:endonuclease domain-containing protein [Parvularcula maris]|uniref:Endonuclease domain-containing protein n=1 Tax=Parvularcula maris TaxID=2965077 RepID=A0A9X2LAM9_9PROT|nr:DUF559 domain-containing protein [Parvularcula maris]MCQ8186205.1 endonuclease domain-containing protein [Parvularcula maris]